MMPSGTSVPKPLATRLKKNKDEFGFGGREMGSKLRPNPERKHYGCLVISSAKETCTAKTKVAIWV